MFIYFILAFLRVTKGVCLGTRAHSCSTIHWLSACLGEIRSLDFRFGVISFSWSVLFFLPCFTFTFTCYYLGEQRFISFCGDSPLHALEYFQLFLSFFCSGFWGVFYLGFGDLCNLLTGIGESGKEIFFDWTFLVSF